MKKIFTILASAVLALTMSSCVKDTTVDGGMKGDVARTIGANIEAMTRTSMNDFEPGETGTIVWSKGDVIGVVTEDGTIRQATLIPEYAGQIEGEFEVANGLEDEVYVYGFYPYQANITYSNGSFGHWNMACKRTFIANADGSSELPKNGLTFDTNQMPMLGKLNEKGTLSFKSLCGVIEVQLLGDATRETIDEEGNPTEKDFTYYNIALQSDAVNISGYCSVDATAENPVLTPYPTTAYNYTVNQNKEYGLNVAYMQGANNNTKGIHLNPEKITSLFFVVPVGTYPDLNIQVACPHLCVTKKSSKAHEVKRNTILRFNPIYVDNVSDVYGGNDVTDLSVDANGNAAYHTTYLAHPGKDGYPKKFKFTAKLLDGTKEFKQPDGTSISTSTGGNYNTTYVYAEDSEGLITDLRREGDEVYFTVNRHGNAIIMIGATNMGAINQWHIWATDAEPQVLPGGHVFLDRNLGATYSPKSVTEASNMNKEQQWRVGGCLYQWGNPTPRPSLTPTLIPEDYATTASMGDADFKTKSGWVLHKWIGSFTNVSFFTSTTDASDFLRTRQMFNFYHMSSGTKSDYVGKQNAKGLWWIGSLGDKSKDFRFGENALWQATKTMFDPCPVGYRVPTVTEMYDAYTNMGAHTGKKYYSIKNSAGQYATIGDEFVFLPFAGFRQANNAALFNAAFSNYPRFGFWFCDPELTSIDDIFAKYTATGYVRYSYGGGGNSYTDLTMGLDCSYPGLECANSWDGDGAKWVNNAAKTDPVSVKVPSNPYRFFVGLGMSLRCVRDNSGIINDAQTPSFEVDTPTDF